MKNAISSKDSGVPKVHSLIEDILKHSALPSVYDIYSIFRKRLISILEGVKETSRCILDVDNLFHSFQIKRKANKC